MVFYFFKEIKEGIRNTFLNMISDRITELEREKQELHNQKRELYIENQELRNENQELQNRIDHINDALQKWKQIINQFRHKLAQSKLEMESITKHARNLEERLSRYEGPKPPDSDFEEIQMWPVIDDDDQDLINQSNLNQTKSDLYPNLDLEYYYQNPHAQASD